MRRRFARRMGRQMDRMLAARVPPLLIRSNQLASAGDYAEAGDGLEQLARAADAGRGPRAAILFLEAGRMRILAGETAAGMALLMTGVRRLAAGGRSHRFARIGERIVAELNQRGFEPEAEEIRALVLSLGAAPATADRQSSRASSPHLPTHCPDCGAPVRPDEVEWLDDATAECDYCGNPIRSE